MKLNILSSLSLSAFLLPMSSVAQTDGPLVQPLSLSSDGPSLEIDLELARGVHNTNAASTFQTRFLGGSLPGPTVRVKRGQWLNINFENNLIQQPGANTAVNGFTKPDESNLHFHGAHVSGESPSDDTTIVVEPGDNFQYQTFFPEFHMGGTHWIHPHHHGSGTLQVGGGAATVLIVEDAPGEVPPEVAQAEEIVLMVQHFDANKLNNAATQSRDNWFDLNSSVGNTFRLVNGQYRPELTATAGEWQRWRVIYGAWDIPPLDLEMNSNGNCEMNLLAKDGIYINDYPRPISSYPITTAGRADIMVRCRATGTFTVNDFGGQLFTLNVVAPPSGNGAIDVSTPPTSNHPFPRPSYLFDLQNTQPSPGCSCTTALGRGNRINGLSYDPNRFVHTIAQGSVVDRTLRGINAHPYHQHVYPFMISEMDGANGDDADYHRVGDYHDTLMIRSSGSTGIRYDASNFHGRMTIHCHRLEHSDAGMMSAELVVDPADGGVCDCTPANGAGGGFAPLLTSPPVEPTPAPVTPTGAPLNPTNAPVEPTPAPVTPTMTPVNPTNAPVEPTPAPVTIGNPPVNPTSAPISSNPVACFDSRIRAIVNEKPRPCAYISRRGLCRKRIYKFHCRLSCGACETKCRDSLAKFEIRLNPNRDRKVLRSCKFVRKNPDLCESIAGIRESCPKTCGFC